MSKMIGNGECLPQTDEIILWESGTVPFGITAGMDGKEIVFLWGLCLIWPVFLALMGLLGDNMNIALIIMLSLLVLWLSFSPLITYQRLKKQHYLITNRRAVLIDADGNSVSLDLKNVKSIYTFKEGNGTKGSLVLGSQSCEIESRQLRERSVQPTMVMDEDGVPHIGELVFYHVEHICEAVRVLNAVSKGTYADNGLRHEEGIAQ